MIRALLTGPAIACRGGRRRAIGSPDKGAARLRDSPDARRATTEVNLNITLEQPEKKLALFGSADRHLRMIRDTFGVQVTSRDDELRLAGDRDQVAKAAA